MKIPKAAAITGVFVVLLLLVYYVHVRFYRVDVVLYSALADACIAAGITTVLMLALPTFRVFTGLERILLVMVWLLGGYAFAISIPTVIDRSLSFYILEKLHQRGGGIRADRFADVFTKEYLVEARLVDVRLTEQLESGTIAIRDGCVRLTPRGERMAGMSAYFRAHFLPTHRLLMGQYTDDLTDPFRHSVKQVDYQCR
jgi:hypothetical protein